jgi:hypothetical protein
MQMRLQSKTGPQMPPKDDLLRNLREQTEAVRAHWLERPSRDPASFALLEVEIHDHSRHLADQMTASLLAQATAAEDQTEPGKKGGPLPPTLLDAPPKSAR